MYSAKCNISCQQCMACDNNDDFPQCKTACEECNICQFSKNYPHNKAVLPLIQKPHHYYNRQSGLIHKVEPYPPNIYWYHNPLGCEDVCDPRVCRAYKRQLFDYRMCRECKKYDPSKCWSRSQFKCVPCPVGEAYQDCKVTHGCMNPHGPLHWNSDPINPKYTNCLLCRRDRTY